MRTTIATVIIVICSQCSACAYRYPSITGVEQVISDFEYLQQIVEEYKRQNSVYPNTKDWKLVLVKEHFLKHPLKDPWGYDYYYENESEKYKIWSLGRDGIAGGNGEDFDYSNTTSEQNNKHMKLVVEKYNRIIVSIYTLLLALFVAGLLIFCRLLVKNKPNTL